MMLPLLTFIGTIERWHLGVVAALALLFAVASYFAGPAGTAKRVPMFFRAGLAVPVLVFVSAFLIFALGTDNFDGFTLFPSIFLVLTAFVAFGMASFSADGLQFPIRIAAPMGLILSLVMSLLVCATIALKNLFAA
jgi:cellulose synthase/poly-beta-1,6-N-acetylglucosamine synthase-like glycosyltransferase